MGGAKLTSSEKHFLSLIVDYSSAAELTTTSGHFETWLNDWPTDWLAYAWLEQNGSITVGCRTYDQEVVGSTPGRVTIKWLLLGWMTICSQVNYSGI